MVTMPGSGFSQLGSGPDCSHRVKTVFWARLLTLVVSLFAYVRVHVQLGTGKVYAGDNPAMDQHHIYEEVGILTFFMNATANIDGH